MTSMVAGPQSRAVRKTGDSEGRFHFIYMLVVRVMAPWVPVNVLRCPQFWKLLPVCIHHPTLFKWPSGPAAVGVKNHGKRRGSLAGSSWQTAPNSVNWVEAQPSSQLWPRFVGRAGLGAAPTEAQYIYIYILYPVRQEADSESLEVGL